MLPVCLRRNLKKGRAAGIIVGLFLLPACCARSQTNSIPAASNPTSFAKLTSPAPEPEAVRAEEIRASCLANRRCVCGRVLKVFPTGVLVDSGYTTLFRSALRGAWLLPSTVMARRDPHLVEGHEPDSVCVGLVFLTDLPRRPHSKRPPTVHPYDYIVLHSYPAGQFSYTSVGGIQRTVRRFSGGLETAVNLILHSDKLPAPGTLASRAKPR